MQTRRRIQLARRSLVLLMLVMLFQPSAALQSRTPNSDACSGPTNDVIVMALQDPDNERVNLIVIKNRSRNPVVAFFVGDGSKPQLHAADFAVPLQILAPSGWKATHVFKEESLFMHWEWVAKTPQAALAPDEMASGFKVILPPFPPSVRQNLYPDGSPVNPVKVNELPFRVQFANGTCAWGLIRPLIVGPSAKAA